MIELAHNLCSRQSLMVWALLAILIGGAADAQDVVTVGTVTASGTTVEVPIFIRDAGGTSLGIDRPAGSKIQSFSIKVVYEPVAAISSISIARDGITASLTPTSEFTPATANSVSILDTFPEATNLIPFTLNASAPGDRVAQLFVTLSASATPGTTISLMLDSALTQLTDAGGTAATKESEANGQLQLVDGSIQIPMPVLTLTPASISVTRGDGRNLTARLSLALTDSTTISLSSADPGVAGVPASIVIPAGATTRSVDVTGLAVGSTSVTATLPAALGGTSASSSVTVTEPSQVCTTPDVPRMTAPPTSVASGATYAITWALANGATEYVLQEAADASFGNAVSTTLAGPSSEFTHSVTTDTRFYYRVRARNRSTGCEETSGPSASVSVLVRMSVQQVQLKRALVVVGSTPGSHGSFFKTSLLLFNPSDAAMSGNIVYHPTEGTGDATLAYSLAPGKGTGWEDLLPAMGRSGLGSADIIGDLGSGMPVTSARVFNDAGVNGTSGMNEDALSVEDALQTGQTGALIATGDFARFRLNIGIRTLEQGAAMTIVVRDREGIVLKTLDRDFPATFFEQTSSTAFLLGHTLTGHESITVRMIRGSAYIYGATTDNKTNDPSLQFFGTAD